MTLPRPEQVFGDEEENDMEHDTEGVKDKVATSVRLGWDLQDPQDEVESQCDG